MRKEVYPRFFFISGKALYFTDKGGIISLTCEEQNLQDFFHQ